MAWKLKDFAERSRYRPAALALEVAVPFALSGIFIGAPDLLCAFIGAFLWLLLTVMTFHRLRNGGLSGLWVWLMILSFGLGPTWQLSHHVTFNLGGYLVGSVPVILAWFAPIGLDTRARPEKVHG